MKWKILWRALSRAFLLFGNESANNSLLCMACTFRWNLLAINPLKSSQAAFQELWAGHHNSFLINTDARKTQKGLRRSLKFFFQAWITDWGARAAVILVLLEIDTLCSTIRHLFTNHTEFKYNIGSSPVCVFRFITTLDSLPILDQSFKIAAWASPPSPPRRS